MEKDTVSALRELYRASEARAARLRLLMEAGRDLALADSATVNAVLKQSARRAALFAGYMDGDIVTSPNADGIALIAPGPEARRIGTLTMTGGTPGPHLDDEDNRALLMLAQLAAAAIDRIGREAERNTLMRLLQDRERRLELVVSRLFAAQEEERRRVSRELHDSVAQTATGLYRRLEAFEHSSGGAMPADLSSIARSLVQELRTVIAGLRPPALDDLGLAAAVSALADSLRTDGYHVSIETSGPDHWPPVMETAFFRIVQEAFSNIRKHSGGHCRVDVYLSGDPDRGRWQLVVRDFGSGFSPDILSGPARTAGERIGLEVMQERMAALGGQFNVISKPGGGVQVEALLELQPA
ncbi:MAG: sensor histidine kinase [Hyphomonas sp.]